MDNQKQIIYLIACALHQQQADISNDKQQDLNKIFALCQRQKIASLVYFALKDAPGTYVDVDTSPSINITPWKIAYGKNVKTCFLLNKENAVICDFMSKNHIWFMNCKGSVLQNYYPEFGMREMSDHDILFDTKQEKKLIKFMKKQGYKVIKGNTRHVSFQKKPCYHFEMHRVLATKKEGEPLYSYYKNFDNKLLQKDSEKFFTKEDFYIHQTIHYYRHHLEAGSGLRPLIDMYVYIKRNSLNFDYINSELKSLQIDQFEQTRRKICMQLFDKPKKAKKHYKHLSSKNKQIINDAFTASPYGSLDTAIDKKLEDNSSAFKTFRKLVFPSFETMKNNDFHAAKHKCLTPLYWVTYDIKSLKFYGSKNTKNLAKRVFKRKKDK